MKPKRRKVEEITTDEMDVLIPDLLERMRQVNEYHHPSLSPSPSPSPYDQAYVDDTKALKEQRPATRKMQMLDEVVREATKYVTSGPHHHHHHHHGTRQRIHEYLLDKGFLRRIRDWLMPLPDKSLPNLTLRSRLYAVLVNVRHPHPHPHPHLHYIHPHYPLSMFVACSCLWTKTI